MDTSLPDNFVDSRDFARIARAIRYLDEHYREQPRLEDVAAHAGLSEFHFNRLFRRWAGVTPKQYLSAVTGAAARGALIGERVRAGCCVFRGAFGPGPLARSGGHPRRDDARRDQGAGRGHHRPLRFQRYAVRARHCSRRRSVACSTSDSSMSVATSARSANYARTRRAPPSSATMRWPLRSLCQIWGDADAASARRFD